MTYALGTEYRFICKQRFDVIITLPATCLTATCDTMDYVLQFDDTITTIGTHRVLRCQ